MQSSFSRYIMLAKRWAWVVILGIVICSSTTYAISKLKPPIYRASSFLIVNFCSTQATPYECTSAGLVALPTYAQLITSPTVLNSVLAHHKGLTLDQFTAMITVKPQANTQIIELDVDNTDPVLAAQLANEISNSFFQFASSQLPGTLQILPAQVPTDPISLKPLTAAGIGALVGLALAIALIVTFEWIDDRLEGPEDVQETVGLDILGIIPKLSRKKRHQKAEEVPALAEGYRILCASLNAEQAIKPFKLVMITSALTGEGRSTVAANLAIFLAMSGKRVLLVDADFRRPVLDEHFQLENRYGFSRAFLEMASQIKTELDGRPTEIPTLRVLTTGVLPPNPTQLLQSPSANQLFDYFREASQFDYIIFDTSPLLPVADAQILASYMQAIVLVVDASKTSGKMILRAKRLLSKTQAPILGVVINKSQWPEDGAIRQYVSDVQQPEANATMTMPPHTPPIPVNEVMDSNITTTLLPDTPSVPTNGVANPNITVTMQRFKSPGKNNC